jgi:uncharacterized repeat protein (TIGR03847 family)
MPRVILDYDLPDRCVVGTVGQPGARTFYLQARAGRRVTTVAVEKAQAAALAERLDELLDEVVRRSGGAAPVPAVAPAELEDDAPLDQPLVEDFRVGTMAVGWDGDRAQVILEAQALTDDPDDAELIDDEDADGPPLLRVRLSGAMARALAKRAAAVVAAGRPPCPFCGQPLDPSGHLCVRANGYRR